MYKDLRWVQSVVGNLNVRFQVSDSISPVVALENTLVAHVVSESTVAFYVPK